MEKKEGNKERKIMEKEEKKKTVLLKKVGIRKGR